VSSKERVFGRERGEERVEQLLRRLINLTVGAYRLLVEG